jgi:hypothetical protein
MNNLKEDNIRDPDAVLHEQLIEEKSDYEKELDEAVYLSIQELTKQQMINDKYEEQLLQDYTLERNKRIEMFREFLFNLNKISKLDKELREIQSLLLNIIDLYCKQEIKFYSLDSETYNKVFDTLKKIRNNKIEVLKTFIVCDNFMTI